MMQGHEFRAPRRTRVLVVVALLGWVGTLVARWVVDPDPGTGLALAYAALTLLLALAVVQTWRWRVDVDSDGLRVAPGLGPARSASWEQIEGVRLEPPRAITLRDSADIRLGGASGGPPLTRQQVQELARLVERGTGRTDS